MLRKFFEGLSFGAGFAISFVLIWFAAIYMIYPRFIESKLEQTVRDSLPAQASAQSSGSGASQESGPPFHELDLKEQIERASVIALAKYEPSPEGKVTAVITEFLKKDPSVTFYYEVGDEYPSSSYYPRENISYGDGEVLFFAGSPITRQLAMVYEGDRIRGLGDMPLALFRMKCKNPNM